MFPSLIAFLIFVELIAMLLISSAFISITLNPYFSPYSFKSEISAVLFFPNL